MPSDLARSLHLSPATFYLLTFVVLLLVAFFLGLAIRSLLRRFTRKFHNTGLEFLFALLESLIIPLLVLTALYGALEFMTLPRHYELIGSKLIFALVVIVIFYFLAKVVILFLGRMGRKTPELERVAEPAAFVVKALFALIAIIIVLENLGIHLTAVWTTLGVGSVAVALALQDTLSNFFAGLYILADRPIRLTDFIKLDSGQEGTVTHIGWRSAQLRTLSNNLVVLPNSTLAKAVITNYSLPEPRMSYVLPVSVAYGSDIALVERVLVEIAQEAARDGVEGLLSTPAPFVRFIPGFGDSSLDFSLIVQVRQFTDQYLVQHELRKRIVERFKKEGIEMPFPTRTIQLDQSVLASLGIGPKRDGQ